jgi:hypothetical protein
LQLSIALILIVALLATTPILAFMEGTAELPFVALIGALALIIAVPKVPPAELERVGLTLRRTAWLLAIPAAWMAIQLLPLGFAQHPIWSSAAAALPDIGTGPITVSVPATLGSLATYLSWLGLTLAASVVLVDRRRAEIVLFAVIVATAIIATEGLAVKSLSQDQFAALAPTASSAAAIGCILSLAALQRSVERRQTQRDAGDETSSFTLTMLLWLVALIYFVTCLVVFGSTAWIGAGLGVITLACVALMARLGLLRIAPFLIVALVALVAIGLFAGRLDRSSESASLVNLATPGAAADRILRDASALGSGAGTYAALAPMYQDLGQPARTEAPSLAIKLAVEWGRASPLAMTALTLLFAGLFIGAAVQRGRDSFYPAASAAVLIGIICDGYTGTSLLNPTVGLVVAVAIGLGLAQSVGRSTTR